MWPLRVHILPTPSGEPVRLVLAGLPHRLFALAVDTLLQLVLLGALSLVAGLLTRGLFQGPGGPLLLARSSILGAVVLALWALAVLWPALFEWRWAGRTPGKRVAGIRVVTTTGAAPTAGQVAARNLLRVADLTPGFGLLGLLCVSLDPLARRVGDWAAGTLVVLDTPPQGGSSRASTGEGAAL